MEKKVILITGTNSGFGWLTANSCAVLGTKYMLLCVIQKVVMLIKQRRFMTVYNSAKFAVEGLTEGLHYEVRPLGVDVVQKLPIGM